MITRIILALLLKLDELGLLDVAKAIVVRRVGRLVWEQIERLVAWADALDVPGEAKLLAVLEAVTDPEAPVGAQARLLSTSLLRWAIETAVERLKASR